MHPLRALPLLRRAALAALILPAAQTAFALQQPQPRQQQQLVESVSVVGNRRLSGREILKQLKTRPGDPYDEERVQRDFQALMNLGFFDRRASRIVVETGQRGGVEIVFELRELPVIDSVRFEGLRREDEAALLAGLRWRGLEVRAGGVLDADKLTAAVRVMERLLRGRGWYNVVIETGTEQVSATSVKLTFSVRALPPGRRLAPKRLDRPVRRDAIA